MCRKVVRKGIMKKNLLLAVVLCFLLTPIVASGIEPAAGVKVTTLLKTPESWNGVPIVYPQGTAELTGLLVEIAPGWETGWHSHAVPSFAFVLEGILEIGLNDGRTKRIQAGEALAEVVDTLHNGRNVGDRPVKIVVFYAGVEGMER